MLFHNAFNATQQKNNNIIIIHGLTTTKLTLKENII